MNEFRPVGVSDEERRTIEILQDSINKHQYNYKAYRAEARYYGISDSDTKAFFDDVVMRLEMGTDASFGCVPLLYVASWFIVPVVIVAIAIYFTIWPKIAGVMGW